MSTDTFTTILDPIGIFTETSKQKKGRKKSKAKPVKPRTFTSGDSLLSGQTGSATASPGTLLGG